jgi:hypothetical protein
MTILMQNDFGIFGIVHPALAKPQIILLIP